MALEIESRSRRPVVLGREYGQLPTDKVCRLDWHQRLRDLDRENTRA